MASATVPLSPLEQVACVRTPLPPPERRPFLRAISKRARREFAQLHGHILAVGALFSEAAHGLQDYPSIAALRRAYRGRGLVVARTLWNNYSEAAPGAHRRAKKCTM